MNGPSGGEADPRRAPRVGDSRAPVTTLTVLAAAAICVVAGFFILRSITDEAGPDGRISGGATTDVAAPTTTIAETTPSTAMTTTTTTSTTTTTTAPPVAKSAATVVVANASGVDRSATAMAADLEADGYTTGPVANATGPRLERSVIYYVAGDPTPLGVARLLAAQIPTAQVLPMPPRPPLDRPLDGATVALILGRDVAGRPLAELQTD